LTLKKEIILKKLKTNDAKKYMKGARFLWSVKTTLDLSIVNAFYQHLHGLARVIHNYLALVLADWVHNPWLLVWYSYNHSTHTCIAVSVLADQALHAWLLAYSELRYIHIKYL
jgi:hypothetical protein